MREPESMKELHYFTDRVIGNGRARVWVFRNKCPECGEGDMGKPRRKGKIKRRAKVYECPECGFEMPEKEYEKTRIANIQYTCPECGHKGEMQTPYKRKKISGVVTLRIQCEECGSNIDITKKMKKK